MPYLTRPAIACILLAWLSPVLMAQDEEEGLAEFFRRYEFGMGIEMGLIDENFLFNNSIVPGQHYSSRALLLSGTVGFHFPLVEVSRGMAFGLNTNANLLLGRAYYDPSGEAGFEDEEQVTDGIIRLSIPLLATFKYGTDATLIPRSTTGFGVGIGYQPWLIVGSDLSMNQVIAMGEINFVIADRLWKLRALAPLGSVTVNETVQIQSFNFSILYLPGVGGKE